MKSNLKIYNFAAFLCYKVFQLTYNKMFSFSANTFFLLKLIQKTATTIYLNNVVSVCRVNLMNVMLSKRLVADKISLHIAQIIYLNNTENCQK